MKNLTKLFKTDEDYNYRSWEYAVDNRKNLYALAGFIANLIRMGLIDFMVDHYIYKVTERHRDYFLGVIKKKR